MRELNDLIIPLQAAATITTPAINAENLLYVSAQIVITGSSTGPFKIQFSNDVIVNNVQPQNWSDIPSATVTVSAAGVAAIAKTDLCYQYIRFVYTNTGTGTMSARMKAIGA